MKMKRAIIGLISAAALSAGVLGAGFERINTYTDNMFADVASESWYASEVKNTYELGLMNGTGPVFSIRTEMLQLRKLLQWRLELIQYITAL